MKKYFALIAATGLSAAFVLGTTQLSAQQKREVAPDQQKREVAPDAGGMRIEVERMQGPEGRPAPGDFVFMSTEMAFGGKIVKGAPYSAQAVSESTQTLSDGNRIVTRSVAAVYRDSEGRTRREQTLKAIGPFATGADVPQTVFIDDPVAGTSFMLNPRAHAAQKMPPLRFKFESKLPPPAGEGSNAAAGEMPLPPVLPSAADRIEMERGEVTRAVSGPGFVWGWRNDESRSEPLGKQNIEGVEAEGTRSTVTIPAGEIGNERPIEIVNERWYSAELQTLVMSRHSDPRFGETSYRLTNIDRSEPAKSLFEIPSDYKVRGGIGFGAGSGVSSGAVFGVSSGAVSGSGSSGDNFVWTDGAMATSSTSAVISNGVLNGKATQLPKPGYPPTARAAHASGSVKVAITIDEEGNVIAARAVSGHPLLQGPAVTAARQAKFSPTKLSGQPVKVQGVLVYTFPAE